MTRCAQCDEGRACPVHNNDDDPALLRQRWGHELCFARSSVSPNCRFVHVFTLKEDGRISERFYTNEEAEKPPWDRLEARLSAAEGSPRLQRPVTEKRAHCVEEDDYPYWSQTYSGKAFDLLHPRAEDVDPIDIAASLSRQCRFGGHVRCSHYSVADHSIRVAAIVPLEHRLVGLLHDAAEAYVVDVPRPLKKLLGRIYAEIEERVARVVGERFGVDLVNLPPEVKHADEVLLATEKRDIMARPPRSWAALPEPLKGTIFPMSQGEAERVFLELLLGDRT